MENRYRRALEKLTAEGPGTKTALIRSLLPEIETALVSGKTRKQVWQRLADEGLDVSYKTFHTIVRRARHKGRLTAAPTRKMRRPRDRKLEKVAPGLGHDPLVGLRRLEESRPGFHYQPSLDLDFLVYGKRKSREQGKR